MPCRPPLMQGPRPAHLVVTNKESHTINKKRRPVIIYVESPKVVHAHPSEFRSVVQRLTGATPSSSSGGGVPAALPQFPFQLYGLANEALKNMDYLYRASEFTVSTTAAAAPVLPASYLPGGAGRSLSFFSNDQLISPSFLFDQNMAPAVAGPSSSFQANINLLGSSAPPFLAPSLGGVSHGNRFIDQ